MKSGLYILLTAILVTGAIPSLANERERQRPRPVRPTTLPLPHPPAPEPYVPPTPQTPPRGIGQ